MATRTSCPIALSALGSAPATSARPPTLAKGATSAARISILSFRCFFVTAIKISLLFCFFPNAEKMLHTMEQAGNAACRSRYGLSVAKLLCDTGHRVRCGAVRIAEHKRRLRSYRLTYHRILRNITQIVQFPAQK